MQHKSLVSSLLFILLVSASINVTLAQRPVIKNLALEGAGIRGLAYAGAYQQLVELNLLDSLQNIAGTSAGAISALCITLGYKPNEVQNIVVTMRPQEFNDGGGFFIGGLHRINKYYGYYKGKKFSSWLQKMIANKTGNANITFKQMQEKGFINLHIIGTSLSQQKSIVFNYKTFPEMRVADAVRISMSVPLYFEPLIINKNGAVFRSNHNCNDCQLMIDGGVLQNYPIHVFDSTYIVNGISYFIPNSNTIGLRIDGTEQVKAESANHELVKQDISNIKKYLGAFYTLQLDNATRLQLSTADWQRTISIADMGFGLKIKKMSATQKQILVNSGAKAVVEYFSN